MALSTRWKPTVVLCWLMVALALRVPHGQPAGMGPRLHYERPGGFGSSTAEGGEAWVSDRLDGVIHVYAFRPFHGDFQKEFRRALFEDRISTPYREDRLLAAPVCKALAVTGADASLTASFRSHNGGAPREHLRVAVFVPDFVALVDISANSPEAFEKHWPSVSTLLRSLKVVEPAPSNPRKSPRAARPTPRARRVM